jgi:hypothetical protein
MKIEGLMTFIIVVGILFFLMGTMWIEYGVRRDVDILRLRVCRAECDRKEDMDRLTKALGKVEPGCKEQIKQILQDLK